MSSWRTLTKRGKTIYAPKVCSSLITAERTNRPLSIDTLCNMWIENDLSSLWNLARSRVVSQNEGRGGASGNFHTKVIKQAVSLGRLGMMGKACRVLETTWDLLKAKHPSGPVPLVPATYSTSVTLEQDFEGQGSHRTGAVPEDLHPIHSVLLP